jgi:hypothetical protein
MKIKNMEKPIEIAAIILVGIAVVVGVYFFIYKSKSNTKLGEELNKACLKLVMNGCNEVNVNVDERTFEEICDDNGLSLEECKRYCGCEK